MMNRLLSCSLLLLALFIGSACDSNTVDADDYVRLAEAQKQWRATAPDTY